MLYDWQNDRHLGFVLATYVRDDVFRQPNPFNIFIEVYSLSSGFVLSGTLDRPSFETLVSRSRIPVYLELYSRSAEYPFINKVAGPATPTTD